MSVPKWMKEINEKVITGNNEHAKDMLWTFWFGVPFPKDHSKNEQSEAWIKLFRIIETTPLREIIDVSKIEQSMATKDLP